MVALQTDAGEGAECGKQTWSEAEGGSAWPGAGTQQAHSLGVSILSSAL
jgi:hypothetical protein